MNSYEPVVTQRGFKRRTTTRPASSGPPRAVLYLRVSTPSQVKTDYDPEGISIPAQRAACQRKAEQIGAIVVDEYVEPGVTGTSMAKRVAFQQMLERIKAERDIDYVIVYKLSRMNRNWVENAVTVDSLRRLKVSLASATEHIDESPSGQMMLGLLAAFNEYRSLEDSADIRYKMGEKAKRGGTVGQAKLGYLNKRDRSEGRDIGTVILDPERAEYVPLAFTLYATGEYTLDELELELADRGLTSKRGKRVTASRLQKLLRDRYYLGLIVYGGEEYPGRHQPLVTPELFERVQEVIDSRSGSGARQRRYDHYLKGTLWCGECHDRGRESRMILNRAVGRRGGVYFYYLCRGVQENVCTSRYIPIEVIEDAVLRHYGELTLTSEFAEFVRRSIDGTLKDEENANDLLRKHLEKELRRIDAQEDKFLDLVGDGELATSKARARLNELKTKRMKVQAELDQTHRGLADGAALIDTAIELLSRPQVLYRDSEPEQRRMLNIEVFERIYVNEDGVTGHQLRDPFADLLAAQNEARARMEIGPLVPFKFDAKTNQEGPVRPRDHNVNSEPTLAAVLSGGGWSKDLMVGRSLSNSNLGDVRERLQNILSI